MKIAILSDIHDHVENLEKLIKQVKGKIKAVIFCGDLCAPFTAAVFSKMNLPTYACLGNVDEDHIFMKELGGDKIRWTPLAKEFGQVKLGGRKVAFCHYPKLGELLAKSKEFDLVCFGHTHKTVNKKVGKALLINPGAVCGIEGGKYTTPTYAIYDTNTNVAEIIDINKQSKLS